MEEEESVCFSPSSQGPSRSAMLCLRVAVSTSDEVEACGALNVTIVTSAARAAARPRKEKTRSAAKCCGAGPVEFPLVSFDLLDRTGLNELGLTSHTATSPASVLRRFSASPAR